MNSAGSAAGEASGAGGADGGEAGRTEATRARILEAAHTSVVRYGLARSSMVDIAKLAGVGRTTVYRHWKDLQTLLAELLAQEFIGIVSEIDVEPPTVEATAEAIAALADESRRSELLGAIREREPELIGRYILTRLGRAQTGLLAVLHRMITRAGTLDENLRERDADQLAAMLLMFLQGAVFSAPLFTDRVEAELWRSEVEHMVLGYLR